jgi:hypothetical protein
MIAGTEFAEQARAALTELVLHTTWAVWVVRRTKALLRKIQEGAHK